MVEERAVMNLGQDLDCNGRRERAIIKPGQECSLVHCSAQTGYKKQEGMDEFPVWRTGRRGEACGKEEPEGPLRLIIGEVECLSQGMMVTK